MKKGSLFSIIIIIILFTISLTGCFSDEENGGSDRIYFLLYYSKNSNIEKNVSVLIITKNIEVFNRTIDPTLGSEIYREKASGAEYSVIADWNNNRAGIEFVPDGSNALSLIVRNNYIELQEITD